MNLNLQKRISRKRTRIVATIGPASESKEMIMELAKSGMNIARLNFSHGDFEEHGAKLKRVREVSEELGTPIAVLQDLAGPEIRLGTFSDDNEKDSVVLEEGAEFILTTRNVECNEKITTVDYSELPQQVHEGELLILDDGKRTVRVKEVKDGTDIVTEVVSGGLIKGRRCLFAPDSKLSMSALTEKDKKDLQFAFEYGVDFIAISFVRSAKDIEELRTILKENNAEHIKIISKLETKESLDNLDEILEATDAVMVARGDLGVELPATDVPLAQKRIIHRANELGKPVITATQMLLSMVERPTPTRAEVSDVSNAILDGTDAVMLSEESALGRFPKESVAMLAQIASTMDVVKYNGEIDKKMKEYLKEGVHATDDIVSSSVVQMANRTNAKVIVALTQSGGTARLISRFKPSQPIIVLTTNEVTYRQVALSANCYPVMIKEFTYVAEVRDAINELLKNENLVEVNDRVVISAGVPFGVVGGTNMAIVHTID